MLNSKLPTQQDMIFPSEKATISSENRWIVMAVDVWKGGYCWDSKDPVPVIPIEVNLEI